MFVLIYITRKIFVEHGPRADFEVRLKYVTSAVSGPFFLEIKRRSGVQRHSDIYRSVKPGAKVRVSVRRAPGATLQTPEMNLKWFFGGGVFLLISSQ